MTHFDGIRRLREQMNAPQRYVVLPGEQIVHYVGPDGPIRDGLGQTIGYADSGRCVYLGATDDVLCAGWGRYLRQARRMATNPQDAPALILQDILRRVTS